MNRAVKVLRILGHSCDEEEGFAIEFDTIERFRQYRISAIRHSVLAHLAGPHVRGHHFEGIADRHAKKGPPLPLETRPARAQLLHSAEGRMSRFYNEAIREEGQYEPVGRARLPLPLGPLGADTSAQAASRLAPR